MVSLLLETGAEISATSEAGETPYHRAVSLGYDDIATILAQHDGENHKTDKTRRIAAHEAREKRSEGPRSQSTRWDKAVCQDGTR